MSRYFLKRGWRDASVSVLLFALVLGLALPEIFSPFQTQSTFLLQVIFFSDQFTDRFSGGMDRASIVEDAFVDH